MPRGRRPLPTRIKELRGNLGKRPLNRQEPYSARMLLKCPRGASANVRRHYKRFAILLNNMGVSTEAEEPIVVALCEEWATYLKARVHVARHGLVVLSAGGSYKPSPYIGISNAAMANILKIFGELGMTPAARTRVKVPNPYQPPLGQLLEEELWRRKVMIARTKEEGER